MPKRYTPEQIVQILQETDMELASGKTIAQACLRFGISEQTFYRWRNQYSGVPADEARRLKELETENARLKKLVAELALDRLSLQEALRGKS